MGIVTLYLACAGRQMDVCMLKMMEDLTNKPEWWQKIWDPEISAKWRQEALQMNWTRYRKFADFTHAMADACVAELRKKAKICEANYECHPWNRPVGDDEAARIEDDQAEDERLNPDRQEDSDSEESDDEEGNSEKPVLFKLRPQDVKTSGYFNNASRIQIIVKLANIELTPEHPVYTGGSWHIEGLLNEHICASALFYYDSENITESRLAFRSRCDEEELRMVRYEQNDHYNISRTFAINADRGHDTVLQEIGSVLTCQGRAVFFPNIVQHRVMPFSLADRGNPGHRKILALFLVDPAIPIISKANVPPQQPHWNGGYRQGNLAASDIIYEDEAKDIRLSLMSERSMLQSKVNDDLDSVTFNFCEH
ncbi:hypothetical protein HRG_005454 [Hirsutella rhossiliensis]|uniref:DUF1665 domain-containing protein n=1 Tax=Hirsutella rhossiliensis TaxID=111463 RepID=A0A9P8SI89_9HYPO|nr:uncharacterized protein HRG_05454 [Hirsutella rhossiliensis]KAH0962944.1 hypothetical protein HRG_05454 [Hirsutella rhossiliensis]